MFYEGFENWEDVGKEFATEMPQNVIPLCAIYNQEDYEGSAVVVYVEGHDLKFVYGSHCSCFGLEDQWDPEIIEWEAAETVLDQTYYLRGYKEYVLPIIRELVNSPNRDEEIDELIVVHRLKYG